MSAGLVIGIAGLALDDATRDRLRHPAVAGVILFARNYDSPEQLRALTADLRASAEPRLLICVDQEGGRVQRFREGFTRLPPLAAIGRWHSSHPDRARDLAYRHGRVMAAEVLGHGVDLSLAPVLDLNRGSEAIGDRAFSEAPDVVVDLATWYVAGMRDAGMRCCGKHYPGHGSVAPDSHHQQVIDARDLNELAADLAPFEQLAGQIDAIMPAHVRYPAVDPLPAGFARAWIQRLRALPEFDGVVISDDLDMAGAAAAGDTVARWRACGDAGCDLALVCEPASAASLLERLEPDQIDPAPARAAAARLRGRPAFTLDEQGTVPEFRAWRNTLNQLSGVTRD